jgi:hypothetical protein
MVYLVHFERPYKHAKHYLGFTDGALSERFKRHTSNAAKRRGSALMRAVIEAGIGFKVVRWWPGDRVVERRKKNAGGSARRCPVCLGRVEYRQAVDYVAGMSPGGDMPGQPDA